MIRRRLLSTLALLAGTLLAACGGGGGSDAGATPDAGGNPSSSGVGSLQLSLTDAPACYEQVNVTVERIRIHRSADAADDDGGWSELVLHPSRRVDLTRLTNGRLEGLGRVTLPAGTYTQMRLVLADNTNADPLANSVKPYGGAEVPLKTPSGQQSGLKLKLDVVVPEGQVAHLVLERLVGRHHLLDRGQCAGVRGHDRAGADVQRTDQRSAGRRRSPDAQQDHGNAPRQL